MRIPDPIREGDDSRQMLVGFSGGLDSTALLHQLVTSADFRKHDVRAVHVNHGLHPDADAWTLHCQRFCDVYGVPLAVIRVMVDNIGNGPEAAARIARHAAMESELREGETLVLAHHRHDQAETFLLRALRASGPDGLGAMRVWRGFGRGWLWRPLLDVPREDLLAYARQHRLQWIEDPSNADIGLDRNFLRHRVLPLLRERWPQVDAAFARSALLSAQAGELLDEEDAQSLLLVEGHDPRTIDVDGLRNLPVARRARVLRRWIDNLKLPPLPAQGIARIESDLLLASEDANAEFAWLNCVVHRWRNLLHADIRRAPLPSDWQVHWDGRHCLPLPGGGTLKLSGVDGFAAPVCLHARRGGERIRLSGRSHSHTLKHVLQVLGVPPWQRDRLPLLSTQDGELLAAGDQVYSSGFDTWLRDHNARLQIVTGDDWREKSPNPSRPFLRSKIYSDAFSPHNSVMARKTPIETSPVADFEASLDQLELLVEKMEHGEMSLEESLAAYERGVGLYRRCQSALEQAELRVRLLSDPDNPASAEPFPAATNGNPPAPSDV